MHAVALTGLVGRDEELRRLDGFLNEAAHGPAAIALIGEAGIGKTTLWRAGVERARGRGFRVLEARPTEAERELSFAALGDLLADVHDELGGLPAPQRRALRVALLLEEPRGVPPDGRAVATALSSLLASMAEQVSSSSLSMTTRGSTSRRVPRFGLQSAAALLVAAAARPTRSLLERAGGDAVDELIAAGVLIQDGGAIRFAHPLLAATAYSQVSSGERATAHRRLALAAADPDVRRGHGR